jgi:hypothetical protein
VRKWSAEVRLRLAENPTADEGKLQAGRPFSKTGIAAIFFISVVVLVPCWWHRRIEAGDLASHVYNAWLAQLIEKGQAPGLYIAKQWNNILFDVALLRAANVVGIDAAQKIVVPICVLVFFWGVFAFVAVVTERPPWFLTPCIAMLAYGYSFSMGFMNYYLSLGLACFGLAIVWRARRIDWIPGAMAALLAMLAHPIGFLWLVGTIAYTRIRAKVPGLWKVALPMATACCFGLACWYVAHRPPLSADWNRGPLYLYNGADQLGLYGNRYYFLAGTAFLFGFICVVVDLYARRNDRPSWKAFELYLVAFCATALLPENMRPSLYDGWIGLLGSRLTTICAIFGLCFLGSLKPRKWHLAGFTVCATVFFAFLYQDTGWLNRLEANAEKLVAGLPADTRVIVTTQAPGDSRISFIGHAVERACIGHCFSYANYEPASGQFRVRVRKGSPVAASSTDDAEDMMSGQFEFDDLGFALKQIYQCDANDLTKLCVRDISSGEAGDGIEH